jgi:hypothetical protein
MSISDLDLFMSISNHDLYLSVSNHDLFHHSVFQDNPQSADSQHFEDSSSMDGPPVCDRTALVYYVSVYSVTAGRSSSLSLAANFEVVEGSAALLGLVW